jgi:hypothetical protein
MSPRLNNVITALDLPNSELWAARLDGEVTNLAEAFLPAGMPTTTAARARALAMIMPSRAILELHSAAWVHGATLDLPNRHTVAVHAGDRSPVPRQSRLVVREVVFRRGDVICIEDLWLTSAARTAIDLARHGAFDARKDAAILVHLLEQAHLDLHGCSAMLNRSRNLPNKRDALTRITAALLENKLTANQQPTSRR